MTEYAVQLQDLPGIPVAVIRRQARPAELSRVVPECCGLVWEAMRAQHAPAGRNVAIYWDSAIRLEVGVEITGLFTEQGDVVRSVTPGGKAAFVTHFGPYGGLGEANRAITEWCKAHDYRLAGPSWEIYGHWQPEWNANSSLIRTDVFYQVL